MADAGTPPPARSRDEVARLGKDIYERDIRRQVEADHHGEVVAIDVDSGGWALGGNAIDASESLRGQHPGAEVWLMRVGHRALYRFGGSSLRRAGAVGVDPLVGMALLENHSLYTEIEDGGSVVIRAKE